MTPKNISPIHFIDKLVKKNELGQLFTLFPFQREILRLAFAFDDEGRLPWDTVVYYCVKKSGKTSLNAALALWWALTQESPNEILVLANDLEQSLARVFKTMQGLIEHNPKLQSEAEVQSRGIYLANGTTITPISGDYIGAAGSNHGFVSFDKLWGYVSESSTRLWEELTPVPTRRNSIRFISTYAGFEGESELLWDLYKSGVGKNEHPEARANRFIPSCRSMATVKLEYLLTGTMYPVCLGRPKDTTRARKRLSDRVPIYDSMKINGRLRSQRSSPPRCGMPAFRKLPHGNRSNINSQAALLKSWLTRGKDTARL